MKKFWTLVICVLCFSIYCYMSLEKSYGKDADTNNIIGFKSYSRNLRSGFVILRLLRNQAVEINTKLPTTRFGREWVGKRIYRMLENGILVEIPSWQ